MNRLPKLGEEVLVKGQVTVIGPIGVMDHGVERQAGIVVEVRLPAGAWTREPQHVSFRCTNPSELPLVMNEELASTPRAHLNLATDAELIAEVQKRNIAVPEVDARGGA